MRLKRCKRCGENFEAKSKYIYMCPNCSKQIKQESACLPRICTVCGEMFRGNPRAKYCDTCRKEVRKAKDCQYKRNAAEGKTRPLGTIDTCECGKEYTVKSGNQRYCPECAKTVVAENIRAHKRRYMAENKERFAAHKKAMRSYNKVCVVCGIVFDTDTSRVTCSDECGEKLKSKWQAKADFKRGRRKTFPE